MSELSKEKLIHQFELACWAFYHQNIGTVNHLDSKNRVYELADELTERFGLTNDELEKICELQMK